MRMGGPFQCGHRLTGGGDLRVINLGAGLQNGDFGSRDDRGRFAQVIFIWKERRGRSDPVLFLRSPGLLPGRGTCILKIMALYSIGALSHPQAI